MSNPPVLACDDCKEYIYLGQDDAEEWTKRHMYHTVSLGWENLVGGWGGAMGGWKWAKPKKDNVKCIY